MKEELRQSHFRGPQQSSEKQWCKAATKAVSIGLKGSSPWEQALREAGESLALEMFRRCLNKAPRLTEGDKNENDE